MKLKTHVIFNLQLTTIVSDGLLWFMVKHNGKTRIERITISKSTAATQLSSYFNPTEYKFINITNQMPVFKKL